MRRFIVIGFTISCSVVMIAAGIFAWLASTPRTRFSVFVFGPRLHIKQTFSSHDENHDGINDTQQLINGARDEVARSPTYRSAYYQNGYPPDTEGVCSDLVWRAFKQTGYDLKQLVDADIRRRPQAYQRTEGKPDPNIDFRRVPNLNVFFKKYARSLTLEIKPGDEQNLKEWQGGDLVIFDGPKSHIGIISDRRMDNGVPFLLHNAGQTREDNGLIYWKDHITPIIGHYRWPKD